MNCLTKRKRGLPQIINKKAKVLILGSFPGEDSLKMRQYYANRRNYFWKIIFKVLREKDPKEDKQRTKILEKNSIGLWDVVYSCFRKGSADTKIRKPRFNNITKVLKEYPNIKAIFLNGSKANRLFDSKFLKNKLNVHIELLPSTSPANAGQTLTFKYSKWKKIRRFIISKAQGGVK